MAFLSPGRGLVEELLWYWAPSVYAEEPRLCHIPHPQPGPEAQLLSIFGHVAVICCWFQGSGGCDVASCHLLCPHLVLATLAHVSRELLLWALGGG